ncbi:penicillin acylase family protein [Flavobacteriaceae bacterium]|nr:penicillin acylase family protein [Flavobacteriaceae bacterium]
MRILKKTITIFLILISLLFILGFLYYQYLKPNYSGEITLNSVDQETTVYFDEYGIPHIYAKSHLDAVTTLGYVQAQDRLWQMELMRRIAPGKLSELFGKDLIKNDQFFINIGIDEYSKKSVADLDITSPEYQLLEAYLKGVNQFIDEGATPLEYHLIGLKKEHFTLVDTYNVLGYMAFSFAMAQKTDPLLSALKEKLGTAYLNALPINIDPESVLIKSSKEDMDYYTGMVSNINTILNATPIPPFVGSNSWVIGGDKTESGKVIFANDPHIGFSQPSVWFEAHLTSPEHEIYGYFLPIIPFPLLGHNNHIAYGLTMFENDDIDFYKEVNNLENSNKYQTPNGYASYENTTKIIKVKDQKDLQFNFKTSRHGPIISGALGTVSDTSPVAMSWIYTQVENHLLKAIYRMSTARNKEDFKKGVSMIHAPGLNVMYGDAKGNIGWWATGKLYKFNPHVNSKFILDGASARDDKIAFLDFSENPMAENPPWNYVYSANNQPDSIAGMLYPGYYLPEDRAKRIVQLLEPKDNWNKTSTAKMITDVTSSVSGTLIQELTKVVDFHSFDTNVQKAIDILQLWDGSNEIDEVAPTIYNKFIYEYLTNTFKDEMGTTLYQQFNETHLMKRVIGDQLLRKESIWWDDINTQAKVETRKDILTESLIATIKALENQFGKDIYTWNWGRVHVIEHQHPLGSVDLLKGFFNVGPFSINGASEVINNLAYKRDSTGIYQVKNGPSTRRIIDFNDLENSWSILPTGQSGNPFSEHYRDQASMYNEGTFRKMKMNQKEIIKKSTKVIFKPKN